MPRLPTFFLSHGSPMLALENEITDEYIKILKELRGKIPVPKAILSIGAHFYGPYKKIDISEQLKTIYDFYGFPKELYSIKYQAPGYPEGEMLLRELAPDLHYEPIIRGLDHGTWTIFMHLFPEAHIPIFSLSIDSRDSLEENFKLGEKLRILRDHEILIITNGNIVHNLGVVDFNLGTNIPHTFARDFDTEFKVALDNRDYRALFNPYILKGGTESIPSPEHYIPAIITLGTAYPDETVETIYSGFELGSIGRRTFGFGIVS